MILANIVGAGDVVQSRYVHGLRVMHERDLLGVGCVVDVRPSSKVRCALAGLDVFETAKVRQLKDASPYGLVELLRGLDLLGRPVILANPTPFHVPYASALLDQGAFVGIEKPYADNTAAVTSMDATVKRHGTGRIFLFEHYALERALALRVLGAGGEVDRIYLDSLIPELSHKDWYEIRHQLGDVRRIWGGILEGQGKAASLDHRPWVLSPAGGGNTLETFYHLSCMLLWVLPSERIHIREVILMRNHEANERYRAQYGTDASETLTAVSLRVGNLVEANLIAAKYVPESQDRRWMLVEFEHGNAFADLKAPSLRIQSTHTIDIALKWPQRYATQFQLFVEKVRRHSAPSEFELFRQALLLTLDIREAGLAKNKGTISEYATEDIDEQLIARWLGGH